MSDDPNTKATRIVRKATDKDDRFPPNLETAWETWIKGIQGIDERMRTLLRAAFKTGVEAATKQARSNMAREGGLKGGKARAKKLAPEERRAIARKAANKRWGD